MGEFNKEDFSVENLRRYPLEVVPGKYLPKPELVDGEQYRQNLRKVVGYERDNALSGKSIETSADQTVLYNLIQDIKKFAPDKELWHSKNIWPIDPATKGFTLMKWFGEKQFYNDGPDSYRFHNAIDIAVPPGTDVKAPFGGMIVNAHVYSEKTNADDGKNGYADLQMYTDEGVLYDLVHLDADSLPDNLLRVRRNDPVPVGQGDYLGKVKEWHWSTAELARTGIILSDEILRVYDQMHIPFGSHLHFEAVNYGPERKLEDIHTLGKLGATYPMPRFNPLIMMPKFETESDL